MTDTTNHTYDAADRYNSVVQEFGAMKFVKRPDYGVALSYAVDIPLLHEVAQAHAKTDLEIVVGKLLPAAYDARQTGRDSWLVDVDHDAAVPLIENTGAMNAGRIFGRGHSPNSAANAATGKMRGIASNMMMQALNLAAERELPFTTLLLLNYADTGISETRLNTMFFDSVFDTARLIAHAYVSADSEGILNDGLQHTYYAEPLRECAKYLSPDDRAEIVSEVVLAHRDTEDDDDVSAVLADTLANMFVAPPTRGKTPANGPVAALGMNFSHLTAV